MKALEFMGRADDFGAVLKVIVSVSRQRSITSSARCGYLFKANYMSQHEVQSNQ